MTGYVPLVLTHPTNVARAGSFVLNETVPVAGPAAVGSIVRLNVAEVPAGIVTGNPPLTGVPVTVVALVPGVPAAPVTIRFDVLAALEIVTVAVVVAVPAAATFGAVAQAGDGPGEMLAVGGATHAVDGG